jgi:hypothetical protein
MPSTARLASLALAAALSACSYSYRNPAETLGAGEVTGYTVGGGALQGVAVSLKGSTLTTTSRGGGHFMLLPLPVGHHTLVLRDGKDRAAQVDVDLGWGKDSQVQGLALGSVAVPAAVEIAGSVTLPGGASLGDDGLAVDEVSGATARVTAGAVGHYEMQGLAVGTHRLRVFATDGAGTAHVGGPVEIELTQADAGLQKVLLPLTLRPATTATGSVTLRVSILGAVPDLALGDLTVQGLGPVTIQPSGLAQVDVAERIWTVAVQLPPRPPAATPVDAPPPVKLIVLGGDRQDLGTLYVVAGPAQDRVDLACHDGSDCGAGSCSGSVCVGFTPPDVAPASVPFCDASAPICAAQVSTPVTASCITETGLTAAVACGAWCTPDGVHVLHSVASVPPVAGDCPPWP